MQIVGKNAIKRVIRAYGFNKHIERELTNYLEIPKSTFANRVMRNSFPSAMVIRCALETGASIKWLATNEGPMFVNDLSDTAILDKLVLSDNKLKPDGYIKFAKNILPGDISALEAVVSGSIISIFHC